jgi:hypothetical protein
MPFIDITLQGLDQRISALDEIIQSSVKRSIVEQTSSFMEQELKKNAHVSTEKKGRRGYHMRDLIRVTSLTDKSAIVNVPVPYAVYENRRPGNKPGKGPHNFADRAEDATRREMARITKQEYDRLFGTL